MARENVERIERAFEALWRGDLETALADLDPSFEVVDHVAPEADPVIRGPQAMVENLSHVSDAFDELRWELLEVVDLGDRVLARVRMTGKGKHSALAVEEEVGHVYAIENGRAVRLDIFRTWDEARAASGNADLVRRAFEAWERGEASEVLGLMSDDIVTYRADPDGASYHGKEGFFEALADWTEGFSAWSVHPEEFRDLGNDHVVVRVNQRATGEASGIPIAEDFWFVFQVRDRTVSRLSFFIRERDALRAAEAAE